MKVSSRSIILAVLTILLFVGALVSVFMDKPVTVVPEPEPDKDPVVEDPIVKEPEPVKPIFNGSD